MSGTEASWVPWVMGGARGIGGYLAGGGDDDKIVGMPLRGTPYYAPDLYHRMMGDLGTGGAVGAQRASRDVSLPSAVVQQPPMIKGPLFADVGLTGMDPALRRPELLRRSGVDWGDNPPFGQEVSGDTVYKTATQENPPQPMLGGGFQEIEDALGLIGVTRDANNMLTFAANQFDPTPAQLSLERKRTGKVSRSGYDLGESQYPRDQNPGDQGESGGDTSGRNIYKG